MLAANPIFAALDPAWSRGGRWRSASPSTLVPGLTAELFAVPGKVPLYLEGETVRDRPRGRADGRGARIGGRAAFYVPGCAAVTPALAARLDGAPRVFFDGTLWRDDEMIRAGVGTKTGRRMGHMPISGPDGSIAAFAGARASGGRSSST